MLPFYFIKDKERTEKEFGVWNMTKNLFNGSFKDKYHFFVVQTLKDSDLNNPNKKQFIVTSAMNDGDEQMSWNELLKIQPKLKGLEKVLAPKPISGEEKEDINKFRKGLSDQDFAKLPYKKKDRYLDIYIKRNVKLSDVQFASMPKDLKNKYLSFGVGLSNGQLEMIRGDKKLVKRYRQITDRKLEEFIKLDDFKDDEEKEIALNNLKCLQIY